MNSAAAAPARGGLFGRAGGFMGGLAAGFLGAGLLGMLFGGGLFGGLGGLSSIIGLIIQIALVVLVVRLAMSWWQRRRSQQAAYANADAGSGPGPQPNYRSGLGGGSVGGGLGGGLGGFGFGGASNAPLEIKPDDYEAFERLLGDVQAAWSNEDVAKLHTLATPEMVSYFEKDLGQNRARNVVNKVTNVKLLQGDLAEAWREGETDYATVALRFALTDKTLDRNSGAVVAGSEQPGEVDRDLDLRPPSGQRLGIVGDPADQLIVRRLKTRASCFGTAPFFFEAAYILITADHCARST